MTTQLPIIWYNSLGEALTMKDISDLHLINIIEYLKQKAINVLQEGYYVMKYGTDEKPLVSLRDSFEHDYTHAIKTLDMFEGEWEQRGLGVIITVKLHTEPNFNSNFNFNPNSKG